MLATLLCACESGLDQRYLEVTTAEVLVLPPDLTEYTADSKFELPPIFSGDDPLARDKPPVLAKVESIQLQGSGNFYWLTVEEPVDNLYKLIKNFWVSEGYRIELDEPVIGIMQTDWVFREEGGKEKAKSWFDKIFSSEELSARQDQFKTRIERDAENNLSRIYISHRATEFVYTLQAGEKNFVDDDSNQWRFRRAEPETEVEMLSRLMIYLGVQKVEADKQLQDLKLFSPRAFKHIDSDENSPYLLLKDPYTIAWNRVYHQLERMNFTIKSANFDSGFFSEGDITFTAQVIDDKDGIFSFLATKETKEREMVLVIKEETHALSKLSLETFEGELDSSPEGARLIDLLYRQLR